MVNPDLITLEEFVQKIPENRISVIYLKVKCKNPECGQEWGCSVESIDNVLMISSVKQFCRECAIREMAKANK